MKIFEKIILLGRPASGKSEVINYIKNMNPEDRLNRFHLGNIKELDDFPMLWTWFEEDAILAKKFGKPRIHTDAEGYFIEQYLWNLLIERISLDYSKLIRDDKNFHENGTALVEFSRGTEHGGYKDAFNHLSKELLEKAALVYINVPYEESLRKNRKRFNPNKPDSILEHGLPDDKLEKMYRSPRSWIYRKSYGIPPVFRCSILAACGIKSVRSSSGKSIPKASTSLSESRSAPNRPPPSTRNRITCI